MQVNQKDLDGRLNAILSYNNFESDNPVLFYTEIEEENNVQNPEEEPVQEFLIHFHKKGYPVEQTFHGFSCDYDDYEDLVYHIGEMFFIAHINDALIDSEVFSIYTDNLYYIFAFISLSEADNPMAVICEELNKIMTREDYAETISSALEGNPNLRSTVYSLLDKLQKISSANLFRKYLAETFRKEYKDCEITPNYNITNVHSKNNVRVWEMIEYARDNEKVLPFIKNFLNAVDEEDLLNIFYSICLHFPRAYLKTISEDLNIDPWFSSIFMSRKTVRNYVAEQIGDDFEDRYQSYSLGGEDKQSEGDAVKQRMMS